MRVRRPIAVTIVCSMLLSTSAWAGGAPAISVNLVRCMAACTQAKVTATVPDDAVSGRVYFKADRGASEYYVDMRRAGSTMWAFLPAPSTSTQAITYRVVTRDARGAEVTSNPVSVGVRGSCPAVAHSEAELDAMSNIVLGLTTPSQSAIPSGFECANVVRYVTTQGEMRVNDFCRNVLASTPPCGGGPVPAPPTTAAAPTTPAATTPAATTPAATTPAAATAPSVATPAATTAATTGTTVGGGLSARTIAALTAAGLLAAGILIYENQDDDDEENSPSRP